MSLELATKASKIPAINNVQIAGTELLLDIFESLDEEVEHQIGEFIKVISLELYSDLTSQRSIRWRTGAPFHHVRHPRRRDGVDAQECAAAHHGPFPRRDAVEYQDHPAGAHQRHEIGLAGRRAEDPPLHHPPGLRIPPHPEIWGPSVV